MIDFFIQRPIFALVIAILITMAGALSMYLLPIAQFPPITPPQVQVKAHYPGATAQVVADTVTTPMEEQINGVEGMIYMASSSTNNGDSVITITFEVGYDQDIAAVDVQNKVENAKSLLPNAVLKNGIQIEKVSSEMTLVVNLLSPNGTFDNVYLGNYADIHITDPLLRVYGVGGVTNFGLHKYAMRIWLDPDKMASLNVSVSEVKNAVSDQNQQVTAGKIGQPPVSESLVYELPINALGRLSEVEEFENIIIRASDDGAIVRLGDVAHVELGAQDYTSSSRFNDKATATLAVYQLPDANAVDISKQVNKTMELLKTQFPEDITYEIAYDTTDFVRASLGELLKTFLIALLLVIGVVYVFLQSWRTTLIPCIAIPVSLIGTFALMLMFGFSINTLSLFGLVLAIGLVVDDAIVVVENVQRQLQQGGKNLHEATSKAMQEVKGPIIATTLVLLAVFVPAALMPGITGQMYNQFALSVAFAVTISALNSLTLSPAMCAAILQEKPHEARGFFKRFNEGFNRLNDSYQRVLQNLLQRRLSVVLVFVLLLVVAFLLMRHIPVGFVPDEDQGYFIVTIKAPDATTLQTTDDIVTEVQKILQNTQGVQDILSVSGFDIMALINDPSAAFIIPILEPWDKRKKRSLHADALIEEVQAQFADIQTAEIIAFDAPPIPGIGSVGGFEFEIQDLTAQGSAALDAATQAILTAARKQSEISQITTTFTADAPQLYLDIDRDKIRLLNASIGDVFDALQIYLGSLYVNEFNKFGRTYQVILQAQGQSREQTGDALMIHMSNEEGDMIPLGAIASFSPMIGPSNVQHYNIYPSASVQITKAADASSGQTIEAIEQLADEILPKGMTIQWTGLVYQQLIAGNLAPIIFLLSIITVFLVLAAQYESWSLPFIILLTVPLAMLGAVIALLLRHLDLDIYAQIGLVLLIGLAAKNAILIVEFAQQRRKAGIALVTAALEAAHLRLRPILMTAFAFIFGVLPLLFASGAGANSRHSLGTTVFGGMLVATLLSLFIIPIVYVIVERIRERRIKS